MNINTPRTHEIGMRTRILVISHSASLALLWVLLSGPTCAADVVPAPRRVSLPWDMGRLARPPKTYPAPGLAAPGVRALFYEGEPYRGRPTRVFAWYGAPRIASPDRKVPAVVLIHGGGGTAFAEWARIWISRGYAAVAMDVEGHAPVKRQKGKGRPGHRWSGPSRAGVFSDIGKPTKDQWMYHAVADVILAHSLLRSYPEVDANRIGVTGISWGGIITCNVIGVDKRFRFAVPVYGCGFLFEAENNYQAAYEAMTPEHEALCRSLWDGSSHLPRATLPILWVNGTNDGHFPLSIMRRSYRAAPGTHGLCIRVRMAHSHPPGWRPGEIYAFADSIVKKGAPLVSVTGARRRGTSAVITFACKPTTLVKKAVLNYTTQRGPWYKRRWTTVPARVDKRNQSAEAKVPRGATAYFFNVIDQRGLIVSSDLIALTDKTEGG